MRPELVFPRFSQQTPVTMTPNLQTIERVFRLVDREVWIVTAGDPRSDEGHARGGLCATWVSQTSLDPETPMLLLGIAPNHFTRERIDQTGHCGVHLLRADQADLALSFAIGSGRDRDKFAGVAIDPASTTSPLLSDCLAWLDCRIIHRADGGDRIYYWAEALRGLAPAQPGATLREQALIAAASDEQRQSLRANRLFDIEQLRPLHRAWREQIEDPPSDKT